jgi:hypothetical protein
MRRKSRFRAVSGLLLDPNLPDEPVPTAAGEIASACAGASLRSEPDLFAFDTKSFGTDEFPYY